MSFQFDDPTTDNAGTFIFHFTQNFRNESNITMSDESLIRSKGQEFLRPIENLAQQWMQAEQNRSIPIPFNDSILSKTLSDGVQQLLDKFLKVLRSLRFC